MVSTTTTTAAARFVASQRAAEYGRTIDLRPLREPLPPELGALVDKKLVTAHRRLVERLEAARQAALDAAAALEAARAADRDAAVAAARAGRDAPAPTVPAAEQALADADASRAAHEAALVESANALLTEALPLLGEAKELVDERIAGERRRQVELLEAALAAGTRAGELEVERDWIVGAARGRGVQPFRPGSRSSDTDRAVRSALDVDREAAEKAALERERAEQGRRLLEERDRARAGIPAQRPPARVRMTAEPGVGMRVERVDESDAAPTG